MGFFIRGEDFYATSKTLTYGTHKPDKHQVEKMAEDLEKQSVFFSSLEQNDNKTLFFFNFKNSKT